MNRYKIYEGTEDSRDESSSYRTKEEAIKAAKLVVEEAKFMGIEGYCAHVIDKKTGEFIFTAEQA